MIIEDLPWKIYTFQYTFCFSGFPNFPVTGSSSSPPSYDSSISSYDAPILDDNSYTAKVCKLF